MVLSTLPSVLLFVCMLFSYISVYAWNFSEDKFEDWEPIKQIKVHPHNSLAVNSSKAVLKLKGQNHRIQPS